MGTTECDCPLKGDSYQDGLVDPCNQEDESGDYLCSKPKGHDGPHAACTAMEHPVYVWSDD